MIMRSQVPSKLTAGKIMELSIENFGVVKIKTCSIINPQKTQREKITPVFFSNAHHFGSHFLEKISYD